MTDPKTRAIKAAMAVGRDVAEGRLNPAALEAAAVAECRQLVGQVIGPGDALWPLQVEVARGVLAAGGVPANELAEWLAVQRQAEGDADSDRLASTEAAERAFERVTTPDAPSDTLSAPVVDSAPPVEAGERAHVLDDACWCGPEVVVVEGRGRRTHHEGDGYYDGVPEGHHVVETAYGEELRPNDPPLRTWTEDQGDGVLVGRAAGGGCATLLPFLAASHVLHSCGAPDRVGVQVRRDVFGAVANSPTDTHVGEPSAAVSIDRQDSLSGVEVFGYLARCQKLI